MNYSRPLITRVFLSVLAIAGVGFSFTFAAKTGIAQSILPADDGTQTRVITEGNQYKIEGGTRSRDNVNLFHSFARFGLDAGEIANFISSPEIQNILARVGGTNPSIINGLIQVTGGNPNLYLMNPAGIIFGSGASLNVPADFVATTATRIGFAEGAWLNAVGNNDYHALVGMPSEFAFDLTQPAPILNTGTLTTATDRNLALIGGSVMNAGILEAEGGRITLVAVPGSDRVKISQAGHLLSLEVAASALETGITPLQLPELLTMPEIQQVTGLHPQEIVFQTGSIAITGRVAAGEIHLAAANAIAPVTADYLWHLEPGKNTTLLDPIITIFPQNPQDPIAYVAIDGTVADYQDFLYSGQPGTTNFVIAPEQNGISVIDEQLSRLNESDRKVDELHIITEGNEGDFWLGNAFVSAENIDRYREQLRSWGHSLSADADILLYSCLTALGEAGRGLLTAIAVETGADVAGSTTLTGNAALGGDWRLEERIGQIEASLPFNPAVLANYGDTLLTYTVTNGSDTGTGSLREQIAIANLTPLADEIRFSGVSAIALTSAQLDIDTLTGGDLTITGENNTITIQRNASASNFRIFNITGSGRVTLDRLAIRNGAETGGTGGGIYNSQSTLTLTESTIASNSAVSSGGGIYNFGGTVNLFRSTVSGNSAFSGGGIANGGGTINLQNSTLSGNTATLGGGGIETTGFSGIATVNIDTSTIARNSASSGGGIYASNATFAGIANLTNTIVAENTATSNPNIDSGGGIFNNNGGNLIGGDSHLADLGDYGGNTQTHALLPGSAAIDAGIQLGAPAIDQRGFSRGTVDIGAFEVNADLSVSPTESISVGIGQQTEVTFAIANQGSDAVGNISFSLTIPAGLTVGEVRTSTGSYDAATGVWQIGSLDSNNNTISAGTEATITLSLTVDDTILSPINIVADRLSFAGENENASGDRAVITVIPTITEGSCALCEILAVDMSVLVTANASISNIANVANISNYGNPILSNVPRNAIVQNLQVAALEGQLSQSFNSYFGLEEKKEVSFEEARDILKEIELEAGMRSSLFYITFVPAPISDRPEDTSIAASGENESKNDSKLPRDSADADILQIVLVTPEGQTQVKSFPELTRSRVLKTTQLLQSSVTNIRRPRAFLAPSQQLYQWIVAPFAEELKRQNIDNLAFIMDAGLRSLPVAALHDGDRFLIEDYSLGMMPSLSLTDTAYRNPRDLQVLGMGASEFAEQNPLPAVPLELEIITQQLWKGDRFLNQEFTRDRLFAARSQTPYGIVHLGTHGIFKAGRPSESYISLGEGRLGLDEIRQLGLHDPPVELLVLSACQTALGDVEAELGFAGLAVAAGVKTALGSLWYVSDEATLALMTGFYSALRDVPIKAEALRRSQLALLRGETRLENGHLLAFGEDYPLTPELSLGDRTFTHPYFWSAFTLIGSPW
ncbi:MAG: CHAT domain-containing protein [Cyanobacteria bacterium P01_E01_bin.42]